ncbi:MAG: hypothetical protein ACOX7B_03435 [Christensenellales bacterium]|jgi:hypothetical protein
MKTVWGMLVQGIAIGVIVALGIVLVAAVVFVVISAENRKKEEGGAI